MSMWVLDGDGGTLNTVKEQLVIPAGTGGVAAQGEIRYDAESERVTIYGPVTQEVVACSPVEEMVVGGDETRRDIVPTASQISHFFISGGRHGQQFHIYLAPPPLPTTFAEVRLFNSSRNAFMVHVDSAQGNDVANLLSGYSSVDYRWFKDRYIISQSWAYYDG